MHCRKEEWSDRNVQSLVTFEAEGRDIYIRGEVVKRHDGRIFWMVRVVPMRCSTAREWRTFLFTRLEMN